MFLLKQPWVCLTSALLARAQLAAASNSRMLLNQAVPSIYLCKGLFLPVADVPVCPCSISWDSCWPIPPFCLVSENSSGAFSNILSYNYCQFHKRTLCSYNLMKKTGKSCWKGNFKGIMQRRYIWWHMDAMIKVGNRGQYDLLPLALLWFQSHQHGTLLFQVKCCAEEITALWMPEYDVTSWVAEQKGKGARGQHVSLPVIYDRFFGERAKVWWSALTGCGMGQAAPHCVTDLRCVLFSYKADHPTLSSPRVPPDFSFFWIIPLSPCLKC